MISQNSSNSSTGSGWDWVQRELDKKTDDNWVTTKFISLEDRLREVKEFAMEAKSKADQPHQCVKERDIAEIREAITTWNKIKVGVLISVIVLIIAAVGQYFSLSYAVKDTDKTIARMQMSIDKLERTHEALKEAVERNEINSDKKDREQVMAIRQAVINAIRESKEMDSKKRWK